jgi:hypothetical protein
MLGFGARFGGGIGLGHELVGGWGVSEAAKLVLEANEAFAEGTVLARELELSLAALHQSRDERCDLVHGLGTPQSLVVRVWRCHDRACRIRRVAHWT